MFMSILVVGGQTLPDSSLYKFNLMIGLNDGENYPIHEETKSLFYNLCIKMQHTVNLLLLLFIYAQHC